MSECLSRELANRIQNLRKAPGLDINGHPVCLSTAKRRTFPVASRPAFC